MTRAIETRLTKLEEAAPSRPVRIVWSNTSDRAEWDRKIEGLIAEGKAKPSDDFLRIRWMTASEQQDSSI